MTAQSQEDLAKALLEIEQLRHELSDELLADEAMRRDYAQRVFQTFATALSEVASLIEHGTAVPTEASYLIKASAEWFGFLGAGQIPDIIADAGQRGRHHPVPPELRQIRLAVAYRHAAGPIGIPGKGVAIAVSDPHPVKTIAGWFGVHPRTVRGWVQRYAPAEVTHLSSAAMFEHLVETMGKRYQQMGRSSAAILRRQSQMG